MCGKTIPPAKPSSRGEGGDRRILLFSTQRLSQGESQRGGGFAAQKESQPRLAALGSPFQGKGLAWTLPPSYGRRCPEGAEVGWEKRYERERGRSSQVRHYTRAPYPPLTRSPFPKGKGCDTRIPLFSTQRLSQGGRLNRQRLRRPKRKPTPPRVVTPSFLWKEVPRRGGGWMGEAG